MTIDQVEIKKTLFAKGSLGYNHFDPILVGRSRPVTIFEALLNRIPELKFTAGRFMDPSTTTLSDFLNFPEDLLGINSRNIRPLMDSLFSYFHQLAIGRDGLFLKMILGGQAAPIPVSLEPARRAAIQQELDTLPQVEREVMNTRYGLINGLPESLEDTAKTVYIPLKGSAVTRERIRQVEAKTLRKIRHPGRSRNLRYFQILDDDALAARLWGVQIPYQLLETLSPLDIKNLTVKHLDLTWPSLQELLKLSIHPMDRFVTLCRVPASSLSIACFEEIGQEVKRLVEG